MKRNQGITIVALVITIILMLILLGVTITIGLNVINRSQLEDIKTNMLTIQGRLLTTKEKHDFDPNVTLVGSSTSTLGISGYNPTTTNTPDYYKLSATDLQSIGLGNIKNSGTDYIVDYNNDCEIYYSIGVKVNGTTYYSLTDLKDK